MLDRERLLIVQAEVRALRRVLDKGETAFAKNEHDNARIAMHSLGTIGEALSDLSDSLQHAEPRLDWNGLKELRNYLAHEYLRREMPLVWAAAVEYTPLLEDAVPHLIAWDAENPAPDPDDEAALRTQGIPVYVHNTVARQRKAGSG